MTVTFEPLRVVAGGDTRSLDATGHGLGAWPPPTTFAGAVRTAVLAAAGYEFAGGARTPEARRAAAAAGVPGAGGEMTFRFAGPWLREPNGALLLPTPGVATVARVRPNNEEGAIDHEQATLRTGPDLVPRPDGGDMWSGQDGLPTLLTEPGRQELEPDPRWITLPHLCWRLAGPLRPAIETGSAIRPAGAVDARTIVIEERRWGIATESGRVVEGGLFSRPVHRPRVELRRTGAASAAFWGLARGIDPIEPRTVRLGGDGHLAEVRTADAGDALAAVDELRRLVTAHLDEGGTKVLLYLATPAIWRDGWRPPPLPGLVLKAAVTGRPVAVSGWDLVQRAPRPVRRAVPAGSVYYYEVDERTEGRAAASKVVEDHFLGAPLGSELGELGFGAGLFGAWEGGSA